MRRRSLTGPALARPETRAAHETHTPFVIYQPVTQLVNNLTTVTPSPPSPS